MTLAALKALLQAGGRRPSERQQTPLATGGRAVGEWAVWGLPLLVGGLLLVTAVPRLVAGVFEQMASEGLLRVGEVRSSPIERERALAWAQAWQFDGERQGARVHFLMRAQSLTPSLDDSLRLRGMATVAAEQALAQAPGQPAVWAQLARLREQQGDRQGAVQALRLSFLTGTFQPSLMEPRLLQAVRLFDVMDEQTRGLFLRQIRLTWILHPELISSLWLSPTLRPAIAEAMTAVTEHDRQSFIRLRGGDGQFHP